MRLEGQKIGSGRLETRKAFLISAVKAPAPAGAARTSEPPEEVSMATRHEPWSVVSQLQNEINRVFGNVSDPESSSATADWIPAVDVAEFADRFELAIDLPGVDPKAVEITLDNSVLTIAGERREEKRAAAGDNAVALQQQRRERRQGRFYRRFILPDTADAQNVNATGRHGVLEITIAKHPKAQPRRIEVQ
jgi:HSP20 family protein